MSPEKIGIRDVAVEAGVSVTTVSHALNDAQGTRVSEETRQRVRQAADRLGYVPSRLARGLRLQRSNTLGLISDQIATTPYAGRLILGAQEMALQNGFTLVLFNTDSDPEVERREIATALQYQVEGILYATMYHRVVEVPTQLHEIPTVVLDAETPDPQIPSVAPDEVQGGRVAVGELVRHGHRRIGFITNTDDVPASRGRLEGYRVSLDEAGMEFDPSLVVEDVSESDGGYRAARQLLTRSDRPTALFCYNDRMAMGAYRTAAELGLRIPDDLSVVGFDNQDIIADGLYPGLTTVSLPHYEMGAWAVETLLAQLRGEVQEKPGHLLMECPLVRRASVAAERAEMKEE